MSFKSSIVSLYSDERGELSIKRVCGSICVATLCYIAIITTYNCSECPSMYLVESITVLALGCFGFTSLDKFNWFKNQASNTTQTAPAQPVPDPNATQVTQQ
jgi:hypothetical protein